MPVITTTFLRVIIALGLGILGVFHFPIPSSTLSPTATSTIPQQFSSSTPVIIPTSVTFSTSTATNTASSTISSPTTTISDLIIPETPIVIIKSTTTAITTTTSAPVATTSATVATSSAPQATSSPIKVADVASIATTSPQVASTSAPVPDLVLVIPTTTPPFAQLNQLGSTTTKDSINDVSKIAQGAVVNIICYNISPGYIAVTTGSGVIIDPRGVILTNAHVAQHFLFTKNNEAKLPHFDCSVRTGTMTLASYKAELIYIPATWISKNPTLYKSGQATGTGEQDYALLMIKGNVNPTVALPSQFPYVALNVKDKAITKNDSVTLAGFPVQNKGIFSLDTKLPLATEKNTIKDEFTFGTDTLDLVQTDVTSLAYQGSSGGAVLDKASKLVGLMVSTGGTKNNLINALTMSYINRNLLSDTSDTIEELLSTDLQKVRSRFVQTEPQLRGLFK